MRCTFRVPEALEIERLRLSLSAADEVGAFSLMLADPQLTAYRCY